MFAVANSALINMLMASRLLYGMSRGERVLPGPLGRVHPGRRTPWVAIIFTTVLAVGLITFVGEVPALGGTTALLLLAVFTVVNIAVLVLRRDPVEHEHFRTPTMLPVIGAFTCAYLASPLTDRDPMQYQIAAILLAIGVLLWIVTWVLNRRLNRPPGEFGRVRSTVPAARSTRTWPGSSSRPSRWATAAASPRPDTPSLARMLDTCTLAVLALMNRVVADLAVAVTPGRHQEQHLELAVGQAGKVPAAGSGWIDGDGSSPSRARRTRSWIHRRISPAPHGRPVRRPGAAAPRRRRGRRAETYASPSR